MFDDFTQPGPSDSGILRTYTTTYLDEVTGSRLDVTSVPGFVARTRMPSIVALVQNGAVAKDVGNGPLLLADIRSLASEVLGAEVTLCATTATDVPRKQRPTIGISRAAEAEGVRFVSETLAFDMMLGRAEHSAFRRQLDAGTIVAEQSPPVMMSAVALLEMSSVGGILHGVGGVFMTAIGTLMGVVLNRPLRTLSDELAAPVQRRVRLMSEVGRQQNDIDDLERRKRTLSLELEIEDLERRKALGSAASLAASVP